MQELKITGATIFVNPFKDEMEAEAKADEEKRREVMPGVLCFDSELQCPQRRLNMYRVLRLYVCLGLSGGKVGWARDGRRRAWAVVLSAGRSGR